MFHNILVYLLANPPFLLKNIILLCPLKLFLLQELKNLIFSIFISNFNIYLPVKVFQNKLLYVKCNLNLHRNFEQIYNTLRLKKTKLIQAFYCKYLRKGLKMKKKIDYISDTKVKGGNLARRKKEEKSLYEVFSPNQLQLEAESG